MTPLHALCRVATLFAALALVHPATVQAQHFPPDEDLQLMLRYLVEDGETPGIVFGILEADGSTRVVSYGTGGPDTRPLGPRSVFEIGSINKTFTGLLLADMVARGEVALDDPVATYLPDSVTVPTRNGRQITLLDLATHQSGLPRLPDNHTPADMANPYADYTIETLYAFLSNHELRRDPGAEGEYSNLGMGLLGHALARAAGTSYRALLHERILDPLGMTMTGYALDGDIATWMTTGHADGEVVPFWFGTEAIDGAGGLRSNAEDMLAYLQAHVGPADSDLERAMRAAFELRERLGESYGMGLGWQIRELEGRRLVMHGGGTGGFSTMVGFDPDLGVGFVRLANGRAFDDDLGVDFLRRGPPLAIPEVDVGPSVLQRYVGVYDMGGGRAAVRLEDEGWLTFQAGNNVRFRMHAASDTSFFLTRTPWRIAFVRDDAGRVTGLAADLDGRAMTGRKVEEDLPDPRVVAGNAAEEGSVLDLPLTPEDIARYEGTYLLQAGERTLEVRIFGSDGQLMAQATGQSAFRLQYQGDHEFAAEFDPNVRVVFAVGNGVAGRMTLYQAGQEVTGERQP